MQPNTVASLDLQQNYRSMAGNIVDFTDMVADVFLVAVPFTASEDIDPLDLPAVSAGGLVSLQCSSSPSVIYDVATGRWQLFFPEPTGGWRFATVNTTNLPATIYGFRVTSDAGEFIGCGNIVPQQFTASGQSIILPTVSLGIAAPLFPL